MASYTHRMLSTPQAIKSTIPNVARAAPPAMDPPCSIVISFPQQLFQTARGRAVDPVSLAPPWRSRRCCPAPGRRRDHRIGTTDMDIFDQPGGCEPPVAMVPTLVGFSRRTAG